MEAALVEDDAMRVRRLAELDQEDGEGGKMRGFAYDAAAVAAGLVYPPGASATKLAG